MNEEWTKTWEVARYTAVVALFAACTGCMGKVRLPTSQGHVEFEGDAAGVRALMDGMNGMITNGKASADIRSASWIHRDDEDKQITARESICGGWGWITGCTQQEK